MGQRRRNRWQFHAEGQGLVLARPGRARFDLVEELRLSAPGPLSLRRLVLQIRQDVWRALQGLRAFSPIVAAIPQEGAILLRAGGQISGSAPIPRSAAAALHTVVHSPANHQRWCRFAQARAR